MSLPPVDAFAPAHVMLRALRERRVSAAELLDLHLRRIARHNPTLNAIVTPDYERARGAAAAADAARARGEDGALLGLPLTIKDSIDVGGLRGTIGVAEFAERRPEADARIVASIRAAGGVILGKTNVPPYVSDWQAANPLFGRTNNPWDPARTPGGSTGGGAAALAAGLTPLEFGSDIAGSIRVPAAFCGVYGHKPSQTAVPGSGHFPGSPLPNPAGSLGVLGPLARSADDLQLALDVVAGPDAGEDAAWRLELPPARHARLADYRVAVLPPVPWLPLDAEIAGAQEALASFLSRLGARVGTAQPESFGDMRQHHELYLSLLAVLTGSGELGPAQEWIGDPEFDAAFARGLGASAADYLGWHLQRQAHRAAYRAFFREWDVLLAPAFGVPAFPHTEAPWPERAHEVDGRRVPYGLQFAYPALATLAGQPATAFPAGLTRAGLPVGLQAIGPYLEDGSTIRFAALVEQEVGGFRPPPGYDTDEG
jgi:amidase